MRRKSLWMAVLIVLGAITIPVLVTAAQQGQAGKSDTAHVDFRPPRIWGTLHYNLSGCTLDSVFNGHGLTGGETYKVEFGPYWDLPPSDVDREMVWIELGPGIEAAIKN